MCMPLLFVGCKDDTEVDKTTPEEKQTLAIDPSELEFNSEGGSQTITITSNTDWSISIDDEYEEWVRATPKSGKGNAEVTIKLDANETVDSRAATVVVTAGDLIEAIDIEQEGATPPAALLVLEPAELTCEARGGEYTFMLKCDRTWRATVPEDEDWFDLSPLEGEDNELMYITVPRNNDDEPHSVAIEFKTLDGGATQTFMLTQLAFDNSTEIDYVANEADVVYLGTEYSANTRVWDFSFRDEEYVSSNGARGYVLDFHLVGDSAQTLSGGHIVGDYKISSNINQASMMAGDMVYATYANPRDYYMPCPITEGNVSIKNVSGNNYSFTGELVAEDGMAITVDFTFDITAEGYNIVDESFTSDLEADFEQEITTVSMTNKGDTYYRGVNIWVVDIWGDDAMVSDAGSNTNGEGSYLSLQFYTPVSQSGPEGTFTVGAAPFDYAVNTVEPGYTMSSGGVNGTWINFYEDGLITSHAPAMSGELTVKRNSDGTYAIDYDFGDDTPAPNTRHFSGSYNGDVTMYDRLDTGDFDVSKTSFTYVADKYCHNNSWILHVESKDYVNSNGQDGLIMEFVLNTTTADQYDSQIDNCEWKFIIAGSSEDYAICSGTVTTYKDGVATSSAVNGGTVSNDRAENHGYIYRQDFTDITTEDGETYNLYHYCNLPRTDGSEDEFPTSIDASEFSVANLTFFDDATKFGYNNWSAMLIDDRGFVFTTLDLYLDTAPFFTSGIPSGTYEYIENQDSYGVWGSNNTRVTYYGEFAGIKSGFVKVENLGDNRYIFTLDFVLDRNDAALKGSFEVEATHIDNLTSN